MFFKISIIFFLSTVSLFSSDFSHSNVKSIKNTDASKMQTKADYYNLMEDIDKSLKVLRNLGFMWTNKGVLYLYDYKLQDGFVKADYKKAEECFSKAIENGDNNAYYFLADALLKQGKINESLAVMEKRLDALMQYKDNSLAARKSYVLLSDFYGGVVLDYNKDIDYVHKAITYLYDSAYKYEDSVAQLQIGMLYYKINKKEQGDYFVASACTNKVKNKSVTNFCQKHITIEQKKPCRECEMKKKLGLI